MILLILFFNLHNSILVGSFTTFTICLSLPVRFFSPHNFLVSSYVLFFFFLFKEVPLSFLVRPV